MSQPIALPYSMSRALGLSLSLFKSHSESESESESESTPVSHLDLDLVDDPIHRCLQLANSHCIMNDLTRIILPHIYTCQENGESVDTSSLHSMPPKNGSTTTHKVHRRAGLGIQVKSPASTRTAQLVEQLSIIFKPHYRCYHTPTNAVAPYDLIEQWIFQMNTTVHQRLAPALCDLFHPIRYHTHDSRRDTGCSALTKSKQIQSVSSTSASASISSPTFIATIPNTTLMDLIIDLYSEFGVCSRHEHLYRDLKSTSGHELYLAYGEQLDEIGRLPHALWTSWSQYQWPLLEPFLQPHLIPDLSNITLEYLLGNESTVPITIERKPPPTYRWRFPLLEWRKSDPQNWRYSPDFELEGHSWRIFIMVHGNGDHPIPGSVAGFLDLRQPSHDAHVFWQFQMIHPTDATKSISQTGINTFTKNEPNFGFNNLFESRAISSFTDPLDGCVVMEVSVSKNLCQAYHANN